MTGMEYLFELIDVMRSVNNITIEEWLKIRFVEEVMGVAGTFLLVLNSFHSGHSMLFFRGFRKSHACRHDFLAAVHPDKKA